MTTTIHYGLLIALAIALVFAAFTDIRRRQIDNWLNGAIALGAPLFWWSSDLALWPDVAMQLGVALAAFVLLAGLFALKMMGGGDVKLLTALALWIQWDIFIQLLVVMAIARVPHALARRRGNGPAVDRPGIAGIVNGKPPSVVTFW